MNKTYEIAARAERQATRYFGRISAVLLIVGMGLVFSGSVVWCGWLLSAVGGYFAIVCYQHHRLAASYSKLAATTPSDSPQVIADVEPTSAEHIDVGGSVGRISVRNYEDDKSCYQFIISSIREDKKAFEAAFISMIEREAMAHPQWSEAIRVISLDSLEIYRGRACLAKVLFKGDAGEFWQSEYDGRDFSALIWL